MAVLAHEGTYPILYGTRPLPIGSALRDGYMARPDSAGTFPVVFVLHGLGGLQSFEKDVCRSLARHGVLAIAPGLYRNGDDPLDAYNDLSDRRAMTDLDELYEYAESDDLEWSQPGGVGVLGVDTGGRFGLIAAATRPWVQALVLAYTPLTGDETRDHQVADFLDHLPIPVLGLYGADDELIAPSTVDEAQNRNQHGQWLLYQGAGHDFLDIDATGYSEDAAADANARILAFFKGALPDARPVDLG